jgi:hypothetical protein
LGIAESVPFLLYRVHTIGLTADIEKAFHQIGLHEKDRDFVRFLWLKDPLDPKSDLESFGFRVIPFGASSSPFILLSVIKKHLQASSSPLAADLNRNIYVDNLISGCETTGEAMDYYSETNSVLKQAGLKLQSWGSNDSHITARANSEGVSHGSTFTKFLGLNWDRNEDTLYLPNVQLPHSCHPQSTKREVLRGISAVYDPLGFISPLTIPARILIQDIWKFKLDWDDALPQDLI